MIQTINGEKRNIVMQCHIFKANPQANQLQQVQHQWNWNKLMIKVTLYQTVNKFNDCVID